MYRMYGKRCLDLAVAIPAAFFLLPVIALIGLLVRINLGAPVFFRQERAGRHGKYFTMVKFRTMTEERDRRGNLLPDAQRITPFGYFLRSTSLDELPTFLSVLLGHMTLVGPRPLPIRYLTRYNPEQMRRHEVTPGITGWAQINGRNNITWEHRFTLDVWYVDRLSFSLDCKILFLTFIKVFQQEGVSPTDDATMEEFIGSQGGIQV
ncbi:MAG: sugar transferase [Caldilineaceae bacterium]